VQLRLSHPQGLDVPELILLPALLKAIEALRTADATASGHWRA
jgi:hypothetical protein